MVYFVTRLLPNVVPNKQGVSEHFSPRTLITGRNFDFANMPKVLFGAYVEASTDADLTNDMKSRTHPCISLGPSGNMQGSLKCFDIQTGKVVTRRTINRIQGTVAYMRPLNYWLRCRPTISRDIAIQIE